MKVLKFELFTLSGIFKTPFSIKGIETYPLPPYSTIIGLLYTALGRKWQGESFGISVQGNYRAVFRDYIRFRKYNFKDKALEALPLEVPVLYGLRLLVHIKGEEALLQEFESSLKKPSVYLYLSGGEYPVKIGSVGWVEVERKRVRELYLPYSAFVPAELYSGLQVYPQGVFYMLPGFLKAGSVREHHWVEAYYVQRDTVVEEGELYIEKEGGTPLWLTST